MENHGNSLFLVGWFEFEVRKQLQKTDISFSHFWDMLVSWRVYWWFGTRWFGIRIGVPLINNPFYFRGSQAIYSTITVVDKEKKHVKQNNRENMGNKKYEQLVNCFYMTD